MKTFSWNVIPCSGIQHKPLSFLAHSIAGRFRRFINNALGLFSLREVFKFGKEIIQIVHFVPLLFAATKIAAILQLFHQSPRRVGVISFILLCGGIAFGMEIPRSGFDAGDYALKSIEMGHPKRINVGGSSVHEVGEVKILFFGCIERADTGWRDYTEVTRLPGNPLENLGSLCDLSAGCPDFSGSSWGQALVCDREDCTVSFVKNVRNLNYRLLRDRGGQLLRAGNGNLHRGCANRWLGGRAILGSTSAISGVEQSEERGQPTKTTEQGTDGANCPPVRTPMGFWFTVSAHLFCIIAQGFLVWGNVYAALWTVENYPGTGRHRIHIRWALFSAGAIWYSAFHLGIAYRVFRDGVFNAWY
jgi:hypothetical protein